MNDEAREWGAKWLWLTLKYAQYWFNEWSKAGKSPLGCKYECNNNWEATARGNEGRGDIKMQREETCQVEAAGPLIDCRFNILIAASLLVIASEKMIPFGHAVPSFIGRLRRPKLNFGVIGGNTRSTWRRRTKALVRKGKERLNTRIRNLFWTSASLYVSLASRIK